MTTERFERFSLALAELSYCWRKLASEEMTLHGLKGAHSVYLVTLLRYPQGLTAPQLCELCAKDKADVSRMMALLETNEFVMKEGTHQNRYAGLFKLTPKGREVAEHVRRRAGLAVELAGKDLTDETRTVFYAALESITQNLKTLSQKGLPSV